MADLVGQHTAEPGDLMLVAQIAVDAHVRGRERPSKRLCGHVERLGPEPVERWAGDVRGSDAPHTGSTFGTRFGEQQGRTVGEDESGLAVARLERLFSSTSSRPPCIR